jgi:hypothetical protein
VPTRFLLACTTVIVYVWTATMASGAGFWRDRYVKHTVLDWLLRTEPRLRRHRERVLVVIAIMMTLIAAGDVRLWPGISLAFGYSFPIALGAYALGMRVGVALSVLAVALRAIFAGRAYGPWWLYAGSALMLAEYLLLAIGVGLLGRAVARLERQTRVLRHLSEFGRNLVAMRDPDAIWREGVEGAVRLTGAEGGFIATQQGAAWRATMVFRRGEWHQHTVLWLPEPARIRQVGEPRPSTTDPASRQLEAPIHVGAPVSAPGGGPPCQLVVFRAIHGPFTPATAEVVTLAALHITTALHVASSGATPSAAGGAG